MDTTTLTIIVALVIAAWAALGLYLVGVLAERRARKNRTDDLDDPDN